MKLTNKLLWIITVLFSCFSSVALYAAPNNAMQQRINARTRAIMAKHCSEGCTLRTLAAKKRNSDIESQAYVQAMKRVKHAFRNAKLYKRTPAAKVKVTMHKQKSVYRQKKMELWKRAALAKRKATVAKYKVAIRRHQANIARQKRALQKYN